MKLHFSVIIQDKCLIVILYKMLVGRWLLVGDDSVK